MAERINSLRHGRNPEHALASLKQHLPRRGWTEAPKYEVRMAAGNPRECREQSDPEPGCYERLSSDMVIELMGDPRLKASITTNVLEMGSVEACDPILIGQIGQPHLATTREPMASRQSDSDVLRKQPDADEIPVSITGWDWEHTVTKHDCDVIRPLNEQVTGDFGTCFAKGQREIRSSLAEMVERSWHESRASSGERNNTHSSRTETAETGDLAFGRLEQRERGRPAFEQDLRGLR